jgi:hypothetical protein
MDEQLWRDLNAWAAQEIRSLNAQIEYVLREAVNQRKKAVPASTETSSGPTEAASS